MPLTQLCIPCAEPAMHVVKTPPPYGLTHWHVRLGRLLGVGREVAITKHNALGQIKGTRVRWTCTEAEAEFLRQRYAARRGSICTPRPRGRPAGDAATAAWRIGDAETEAKAADYADELLAEWGPAGKNREWCRLRARAALGLIDVPSFPENVIRYWPWKPEDPSPEWRASVVYLSAMKRITAAAFSFLPH